MGTRPQFVISSDLSLGLGVEIIQHTNKAGCLVNMETPFFKSVRR